jgi:HD domain
MSSAIARKFGPAATIQGVDIPDSKLCRQITEFVRDTESELLFNHSSRVYYFGALTGLRRGLQFDRELLYAGAMFHDMGLTRQNSSRTERFEVDGANTARDFLKSHGIAPADIDLVWTAIALHTTPSIPVHMHPVIALVTAGVEMDVLGIAYEEFPDAQREAVVAAYPREPTSRRTSSRPSTTGSNTSRTRRSATSRPTSSPTRTRISSAPISAALSADHFGKAEQNAGLGPLAGYERLLWGAW